MDEPVSHAVARILGTVPGLIISQLLVGSSLTVVMVQACKFVEERLAADTKDAIAVWLLDLRVARTAQIWASTLSKVFDRVFGKKHLSWKSFVRSCLSSYVGLILFLLILSCIALPGKVSYFGSVVTLPFEGHNVTIPFLEFLAAASVFGLLVPAYLILWETRALLQIMRSWSTTASWLPVLMIGTPMIIFTGAIWIVAGINWAYLGFHATFLGA